MARKPFPHPLRLPVFAAPMFLVSGPELVIAACRSGTVDHQSLEDQQVTVRHRDTMAQDRIALDSLERYLEERLQ